MKNLYQSASVNARFLFRERSQSKAETCKKLSGIQEVTQKDLKSLGCSVEKVKRSEIVLVSNREIDQLSPEYKKLVKVLEKYGVKILRVSVKRHKEGIIFDAHNRIWLHAILTDNPKEVETQTGFRRNLLEGAFIDVAEKLPVQELFKRAADRLRFKLELGDALGRKKFELKVNAKDDSRDMRENAGKALSEIFFDEILPGVIKFANNRSLNMKIRKLSEEGLDKLEEISEQKIGMIIFYLKESDKLPRITEIPIFTHDLAGIASELLEEQNNWE